MGPERLASNLFAKHLGIGAPASRASNITRIAGWGPRHLISVIPGAPRASPHVNGRRLPTRRYARQMSRARRVGPACYIKDRGNPRFIRGRYAAGDYHAGITRYIRAHVELIFSSRALSFHACTSDVTSEDSRRAERTFESSGVFRKITDTPSRNVARQRREIIQFR